MKDFYIRFFTVNLNEYPNLGWDLKINIVLLCVLPIVLACFVAVHLLRKNTFYVIKQLSRHNATDEKSACTLRELGLGDNRIVKMMLSGDGQLTRLVKRVGVPEYTYEEYRRLEKEKKLKKEKIDFDTARFYLADSTDTRLGKIIDRYDVPLVNLIVLLVFVVVIFVLIILLMPELLTLIDSLIETARGAF